MNSQPVNQIVSILLYLFKFTSFSSDCIENARLTNNFSFSFRDCEMSTMQSLFWVGIRLLHETLTICTRINEVIQYKNNKVNMWPIPTNWGSSRDWRFLVIVKILFRRELSLIWYQNEVCIFKISKGMVVQSDLGSNTPFWEIRLWSLDTL